MIEIRYRIDRAQNGFIVRVPDQQVGMVGKEWVAKTYPDAVEIALTQSRSALDAVSANANAKER